VYEGKDAQGRPVVVTLVRPIDPAAFLRTVGVVAAVRHLDLVPIVDAGSEGTDCFVVQEDPGGSDALTLAGDGPLPVAGAALMAASAAAGLAALHQRGVVHGGVDPTMLVRAGDGSTKLLGAGLAGAYPPPDLRPGTPPGIARYLSPEEVTGRAPSQESDVYRLGLVAYLLLTGEHAFDGVDGAVVAQEQLDGVVRPPQLLNPEVPPALAQIVMRALDKDPGARGTAAQFQADIERVLRSAQVQEVAPPPKRSKAWLWILLVVIAALVALGAVWALTRDSGGDIAVPDVTGMTQQKAAAALEKAGLKTGKVTRVQSTEDEGTVVAQDPGAGNKVAEGSAVDLEVAGAPKPTATPVAVPDVVGDSQTNAQATLTAAGFQVVVTQAASDSTPAGSVVSQAPQAGVIASEGSTVSIVVSTGPPTPTSTPTPTTTASP
jgi:serine/threonine-protein kinase